VAQLFSLGGFTIMKHSIIIFSVLSIICSVAIAAAWVADPKQAPPISLPDAYRAATTALGSATNQFHCTAAQFVGEECVPGSWRFDFYNTNGVPKWVYVCPDSSTHIYDNLPPR
jgi:hypothetical protein